MKWKFERTASRYILAALIVSVVPGCFSLGRTSPPLEQYVVGGTRPADTMGPIAALDGVSVGVRRLDLADYLSSPAIVVRRGAHEVLTSDFHRWGEDPVDGIARAFGRYLDGAAAFQAVDVAPWPVRTRHDFLVQLHVTRFEGVVPPGSTLSGDLAAGPVEGAAHVRAAWEIIREQDGAVLARGATDYREEGWRAGDHVALVALLDAGVAVVARDVAEALEGLVAGAPVDEPPGGDGRV